MRRLLSLRPAGRFVAALALSVALVGCDDDDATGTAPALQDDIASLAAGTADLSTLTAALPAKLLERRAPAPYALIEPERSRAFP